MSRSAIVVTGATGFVGSRLVAHLLGEGREVITPLRDSGRAPEGATGVEWDLCAGGLADQVLDRTAAIAHAAAFIPPDHSDPAHAEQCLRANVLGSLRLVEEAIDAGVPAIVQLNAGNLYRDLYALAGEDDPLHIPAHAPYYLASKLVQETFTETVTRTAALRLVNLRPSAIYGPGMRPTDLIPAFTERLLAGEPIEIRDGGRYGADLVYVDDVVSATIAALDRPVKGPFNVGSGTRSTVEQTAQLLAAYCGADAALIHVVSPQDDSAARLSASGFAALDVTRAVDELGLTPTPLAEGLAKFVDHVREQS